MDMKSSTLNNSICGSVMFYYLVGDIYCSINNSKYSNYYQHVGSPVNNLIISFHPKLEYNIIKLINGINNVS